MKKPILVTMVVIIAAAAFTGGLVYGKSSVTTTSARGAFAGGAGFARNSSGTNVRFGGANGGGMVAGKILSRDSQSLTVQLPNGNSEVVFYSPSTEITVVKSTSGTAADLTVGAQIFISSSTQNSDGSVTAGGIQLREGGGVFRGSAQ